MIYAKETLNIIFDEVQELLKLHYEELTLNKDVVKLDPDWFRYFDLENSGKFHTITARDNDKLVGYAGWFLMPHIHYKSILVASNDVLFLHPDYRLGTSGIKLLKYSESEMLKLGANKITWHIKESNDFRNILYRMGYKNEDMICGKLL